MNIDYFSSLMPEKCLSLILRNLNSNKESQTDVFFIYLDLTMPMYLANFFYLYFLHKQTRVLIVQFFN